MTIRNVEIDQETYEEAKETYLDLREYIEKFDEDKRDVDFPDPIDQDLVYKALDILDQLMLAYENSIEEEGENAADN